MKNTRQAVAPATVFMTDKDFEKKDGTSLYWLGNGGAMVNSHGTILLIDPLLEGYDMPLLIDMPLDPKNVPHVDAVLLSHVDNDHYSKETCIDLKPVCSSYHASGYVVSCLKEECGIEGTSHEIGEIFQVGPVEVRTTPCDHCWQRNMPEYQYRTWEDKEYMGFYLTTPEGKVWYVGDSRLMEEQLQQDPPAVIFLDFSDNGVHIGLENARKLADTYPEAKLILIHWGCVDAPDFTPFNGNPKDIIDYVKNPERVLVLAPGEEYRM